MKEREQGYLRICACSIYDRNHIGTSRYMDDKECLGTVNVDVLFLVFSIILCCGRRSTLGQLGVGREVS